MTDKNISENQLKFLRKIFEIQNKIVVTKENQNKNFKSKSISDIYDKLKPMLFEKQLFLQFSNYEIEVTEKKRYLKLELIVIDMETGYEDLKEARIDIDEKLLMNDCQKVISSKTFLKKTMLDDYFMISENDIEEEKNGNGTGLPENKKNNSNNHSNEYIGSKEQKLIYAKIMNTSFIMKDKVNGYKILTNITKQTKSDYTTKPQLDQFIEYIENVEKQDIQLLKTNLINKLTKEITDKNKIMNHIKKILNLNNSIKVSDMDKLQIALIDTSL